jgi:hypothetical protein
MALSYIKEDLLFNHYLWTVDRTGETGAADLNTMPLELAEGNEILSFANTFLDIYMPDHTIDDLHSLEVVLLHYLPQYVKAKNDVAAWLANKAYFLNFTKNVKLYDYRKDAMRRANPE